MHRLILYITMVASCLSSLTMGQQNITVVAVDPADRLSGASVLGEWSINGDTEAWSGSNITGLEADGGALTGDITSATEDGSVSRTAISGGPDLDLGFNDFLQIRIRVPANYTGDVKIEYGTTTNPGFDVNRLFVIPTASIVKDGAPHTYRLDLGLEIWWRDTLRDLRISPLVSSTGHFEIEYVEVGDVAGTAPALNLVTNFLSPLTAATTTRMESKHICVWWDSASTTFTSTHARRALRMCEESYQVYCKKLGFIEPFREFNSTTTPRYKVNFITWYGGYWAGGWANRGHLNVDASGLADEGWGNPVPHEFGHIIQMAQPGFLAGGHWESHANYLRAQRNLHFFPAIIPGGIAGIDNLTGNSNYQPDHKRHIYQDQRYYLALDDYGTQFGLPKNYAAVMWRDGLNNMTLIEKIAGSLPAGKSIKDVACECFKRWPMLDFVEKTRLRAQHWGTAEQRAAHFWKQGAQLLPQQDKPGWWRVPLERAPDRWAYQIHDLRASAGSTITTELRGFDLPGTGEDWRWCFAAVSADDSVRYSPVWGPGTNSFALNANETQVFLVVTATPDSTALDLDGYSNTKPVDKDPARLRYGYEVRLVNLTPAAKGYDAVIPSGYRTHSNGGGIVGPSATVAPTAYVGPNAKVLGTAKVLGNARIENYAVVQGSATVQGYSVVSGSALLEGNSLVEGYARIRDRARVFNSQVSGRALICGYTNIDGIIVQDDAVIRGCAAPFGGAVISGTAILDHDSSMWFSAADGVHFSSVPWGGWWSDFYAQTLRKPRGLIASYRTEETDSEEWWDEFGALHALLRGAPERQFDASIGSRVVTFDGLDDYAVLDRSVADTARFTFSCWIKPGKELGASEPLLFLGKGASSALRLIRNPAGRVVFSIGDDVTSNTLVSNSLLPTNRWTHVAVTLNGTTATLYVGGRSEAATSTVFTPLVALADNGPYDIQANYLGRDWEGSLFKGSFEDVRFYNAALTAPEVREEHSRMGSTLAQFSPRIPTDFDGKTTIAQSGARNGRIRTLSAWVRPRTSDDVANYKAVFDSNDELSSRTGAGFGLDSGKWIVRLDGLGNWPTNISASLNKWQHVSLAFNGSTATLYINGVQAATRNYPGPATDADAVGKCYRIGFSQTSADVATRQYFDGLILNARVSDRLLTTAEIMLDADGDGFTDAQEVDFASDPLDPQSQPQQFTISGKVSTSAGAAISGATVYLAQDPNAAANAMLTATTDSNGNYTRTVTPGTWYVVAAGSGFNAGIEQIVDVSALNVGKIDFFINAYARASGRVTLRSNGGAATGTVVYFSRSTSSATAPAFTVYTDVNGYYSQLLSDGVWFVTAGGANYYNSSDKVITLGGTDVGFIDFSLNVRNIPRIVDLLFSALTDSLPKSGSTGDWPLFQPTGQTLTMMGSPVVEVLNGVKWVNQVWAEDDGFRQNYYSTPIEVNGCTIVLAAMRRRNSAGTPWTPWTSIVDLFYNRLMLGIRNTTGQIDVWRNGVLISSSEANAIPEGQATILSLVVQPAGQFKVFANGVEIMDVTSTSDMTTLVPGVPGPYAKAFNVGRNDPDAWTVFNGNIGDIFVYKVALNDSERRQLEADLTARFVTPEQSIYASAGPYGYINPSGNVFVPYGGRQTFTISPQSGYVLHTLTINGIAQPIASSYTFKNVTSGQAIIAAFAPSPYLQWKQTYFGASASDMIISGDLADPDGDGVANLSEYAFGSSPISGASYPSPPSISYSNNSGLLSLSYTRLRADLDYTMETASSISQPSLWTTTGVTQDTTTPVGQVATATFLNDPVTTPNRFLRLRVTKR